MDLNVHVGTLLGGRGTPAVFRWAQEPGYVRSECRRRAGDPAIVRADEDTGEWEAITCRQFIGEELAGVGEDRSRIAARFC
jgi:hypothetical protein